MSKITAKIFAVTGIFLLLSSFLPLPASAFTAYGEGTSDKPYRIATCVQLQEIDNDLNAYYILVSDINCGVFAGVDHLAGSSSFTGTLDGKYHSIMGMSLDSDALFSQTNGATIKNLNITSSSVSGGAYTASIVGIATDTTIENVQSDMTITSTGAYSGGLVGSMNGSSSIRKSSFRGSFTGTGAYTGGLVGSMNGTSSIGESSFSGSFSGTQAYNGLLAGAMWDAGTSITDSFSSGTFSVGNTYNGGVVGGQFNGTLSRVYSSADINVNSKNYFGGIVGDNQNLVEDSFSAATLTNGLSNTGGVIGLDNAGSYSNVFFDMFLASTVNCFGVNGSGTCTGVNNADGTPSYFKNNSINFPLDAWDFSTVWQTTSGYPTLRNISSFTADTSIPNNGDANGDGVQDAIQAGIASVPNADGIWSTVETPSSRQYPPQGYGSDPEGATLCTIDNPEWSDPTQYKNDVGYAPQLATMTRFKAYCPTAGMTIPITIIYDKLYDTSSSVLRHFNSTTNSYQTVPGAVFGVRTVGDVVKSTVTYSLTDGGILDEDGIANGIIVDPVGPATSTIGAPNTGIGGNSDNSTKDSQIYCISVFSILAIGFGLRRTRRLLK